MKIMVIDDDTSVTMTLREILKMKGHEVKLFNDSRLAVEEFKKDPTEVVLSDINMPEMDGFKLMDAVKQFMPTVDVVVITGHPTAENALHAMKGGAYDFLRKPFQMDEISAVLERIRQRRALIDSLSSIQDEVARLGELNRRLNVLNALKDNFISNVSHELRTPLAIMVSAISLLKSEESAVLGEEKKKMLLDTIERGTDRLNNIIESVFDLTFNRDYKITKENLCIKDVVNNVTAQFSEDISKKGLNVDKKIALSENVMLDKRLVERTLYHLVSNAVKFNKQDGNIKIEAGLAKGCLEIKITDTGIGVAAEEHESIFDKFYQVDGGMRREYGGAGIGLAAVKRYVDLLGGKITLISRLGEGSVFTVLLPVTQSR